jgi:excisionase family DNA binding protein
MVNAMINDNQGSEMLRIGKVSQLLHVHPNTVRRWSEKGIIKAYRIGIRGDRRFKSKDLEAFLKAKTEDNRPSETFIKYQ